MLENRLTYRSTRGTRAIRQLAAIRAEIVALVDDDLFDFADIFVALPGSQMGEVAQAEMRRRGLSL